MSPKPRIYKVEYAVELLAIASGDLESAKGLFVLKQGRLENICFLAQQSVEKSLKALLCFHRKPIIHTHDIEALIAGVPDFESIPNYSNLDELTQYALIRRYEQGFEILQEEDLKVVLDAAAAVLNHAAKIILPKGN